MISWAGRSNGRIPRRARPRRRLKASCNCSYIQRCRKATIKKKHAGRAGARYRSGKAGNGGRPDKLSDLLFPLSGGRAKKKGIPVYPLLLFGQATPRLYSMATVVEGA